MKHPCQFAFGYLFLRFPLSQRFSSQEGCLRWPHVHFLRMSQDTDSNSSSEEELIEVNTIPWSAIFTISAKWFGLLHALHNFANAGHLVRCLTWLLLQCLQRFTRSLGSGRGCFCIWPLLRRFGGASTSPLVYCINIICWWPCGRRMPADGLKMSAGGFGWSTDIQTLFKQ